MDDRELQPRFARLTVSRLACYRKSTRTSGRRSDDGKRTEVRIREILDIRDAIGDDLMEVIGADTESPAAFRAELPFAETADDCRRRLMARRWRSTLTGRQTFDP